MERKLATIAKILDIQPIEGADNIEVATIRGWHVVIRKGEFSVGELVVYCEVDSFLPIRPEFEFLRKSCYKKMFDGTEGFRIKTARLRGQVSQGIAFPLGAVLTKMRGYYEGEDVTELLGITKYEPYIPAQLMGEIKGPFPSFIPKTDEERCVSGNTIIETENGDMTMREIVQSKSKVKIKCYNEENKTVVYGKIHSFSEKRNSNDWFEIETESGKKLIVTSTHHVYLPELGCYRKCEDLKVGDCLLVNS